MGWCCFYALCIINIDVNTATSAEVQELDKMAKLLNKAQKTRDKQQKVNNGVLS